MEHLGKQEREEEDFCLGLVNDPGDEVGAQTIKIYLLALNIRVSFL